MQHYLLNLHIYIKIAKYVNGTTIQYIAALLQNGKRVLKINGKLKKKKIFILDTTP